MYMLPIASRCFSLICENLNVVFLSLLFVRMWAYNLIKVFGALVIRVFSDVLVAFLFLIFATVVDIKIKKNH